LEIEDKNPTLEGIYVFFTYIILLNTLIPISLIVSIEIVKFIQGYFIKEDMDMFIKEEGINKGTSVFTTSINEELG